MSEQEIFNKLTDIVVDALDDEKAREKISYDTNIFKDLGVASISLVFIAMSIEDAFGVKINNEDIKNNQTVKDWVSFIQAKI